MRQDTNYQVTNVTIPDTDLPKIKLININNVLYRCERDDNATRPSLSHKEIQDLIQQALASDTDSKTINIINIQDKEIECPEAKRQREEFLKSLIQPPIQRPDSAHSFIESISEIKEIEELEPATLIEEHSPAQIDHSGYQSNPKTQNDEQVKQILKDLMDETKPRVGEPKYILTKVTKYITKRINTEKRCVCK